MPASVKVRLLGGLELTIDGTPVALAGMRQKAVLALLVLSRDRTLSVDRIVDDLWGDAAPATARKAVQVYVSQLRRALGDQAGLLATDEAGYRVSALIATDVDAFERLVDEGRELLAAGHAEESAVRLRDALALWRGDPLADFTFEAFARDEIARLDERRLAALELRLEADLRAGRHADIAAELERLVHSHPLRERLRAQLMLALYRSGRQSEALQVYQDGRRLLADELGIDPGPELRTLQAAILAHDPELAPPRRLRSAPRRPRALVALGGLLVLGAAVAAAAVELTAGGGTAALAGVSGNEVGVIDPSTNTIVEQVPVGETPTSVEVGDGAVWVLNADSRTISRIDPQTGTVQSNGTGATPAGIAIGGGAVWVSYASTTASGRVRIQRLNPDTLALGRTISLPQRGVSEGDQPLVYAAHAVWVVDQANDLDRVAAGSGHVRTVTRGITPPIASGDGAVWAATTGTGGTTALVRVDLKTGAIRRLQTPIVQLQSIAVGAGAVWATDGFSGSVWRIQDTRPVLLASVHVGLGADAVAVGSGAVWVASGIDGTVTRIDLHARRVLHTVRVGDTPQGLAYGAGRVWVSVAGGGGEGLGGAQVTAPPGSLPALPQSVCGPVIYAGPGRPQYLIASDLPLDPADAPQTRPMVEAIKFVLREHNFRAGRNRVGYQSCDDSTAQVGSWTAGKCQANAASFVSTGDVIGVIGPFNSGCATEEIPITNRGGLAMVSPTNSYIGLTRAGPGALPGDPARLYPTGVRTYTRVYPPDDAQAAADAVLATQLGAKRVYVLRDADDSYGASVAAAFVLAARKIGIAVAGQTLWQRSSINSRRRAAAADLRHATALARDIRASAVGAVLFGGLPGSYGGPMILRLRALLGRKVVFIADDGFLGSPPPRYLADAEPIYVSSDVITDPGSQLPPTGRRFVAAFRGTQPARAGDLFSPFAAQAADVLLQAIARSDGTRASVAAALRRVRVHAGILGSFAFDRDGDITVDRIGIYRIADHGRSMALDRTITIHSPLLETHH